MEGHTSSIRSVCFSHDGKLLASGSGDTSTRLWDPATGREIAKFEGHSNFVSCLAFNSNGKLLASGSYDDTLKIWDMNIMKEIKSFKNELWILSFCFSWDGSILATSKVNQILLWDTQNWKLKKVLPNGYDERVISMCYHPKKNI